MRKAGVDNNVRAVIFGHSISGDLEFRYDNGFDLLDAIDRTSGFWGMDEGNSGKCLIIVVPKARLELARGNPH